nr:ArsR family transcriptional regulator [Enterococcus florum]
MFANPKPLEIIDLLSCVSLCVCNILDHFDFTQTKLSHHTYTHVGEDMSQKNNGYFRKLLRKISN